MRRLRILAFVLATSTGPAAAADFIVDDMGDAVDVVPGDGVCATAAGVCTLRAAIQETNALVGADSITLPAGTVLLSITGLDEDASATGDLDVNDDLTITGQGAGISIVDAQSLDRVLDLRPAVGRNVHLVGLTLQHGLLNTSGSGSRGAGMRVGQGVHLTMSGVTLASNVLTSFGGAGAIDNFGCVSGDHVRIVDNGDPAPAGSASALAGGVFTTGADSCFTLVDSEISRNRGDSAGAIYAEGAAPITLRRTLIAENVARFAGAMLLNQQDMALLENVTISGNQGDPGAILNDGGSHLTLINSTVTRNGPLQGSGVVGGIADVHGGTGLVFMTNTIVAGNGPANTPDCTGGYSVSGGNLIGDITHCNFAATPGDQLDVDPGLGALADNGGFTRTHLIGTAAIDRGVATGCPQTDQRDWPRPAGAACDIGAIEMQSEKIFVDGFDGL